MNAKEISDASSVSLDEFNQMTRRRSSTVAKSAAAHAAECPDSDPAITAEQEQRGRRGVQQAAPWSRQRYVGSLLRNFIANLLPALYTLLSRLWLTDLNPAYISLASTYFYIGGAAEIVIEGLPKAGWRLVGDESTYTRRQRFQLAYTLILAVAGLGALLMASLLIAAPSFVSSYVPHDIQSRSLAYVRLSAGSVFFSIVTNVLSVCTRALDEPDVPLLVQSVSFVMAITLDLLFISRVRVTDGVPSVNTQATIKLICDGTATAVGLAYLIILGRRRNGSPLLRDMWSIRDTFMTLKKIWHIGWPFLVEVIPRTAFNLWWSAKIVGFGEQYSQAWGIFSTIRAGVLFAPLLAVEGSCYTFVAHAWSHAAKSSCSDSALARKDFWKTAKVVLVSAVLITGIEITMYVIFAFGPGRHFAFYFAEDTNVSNLVVTMWRRLDWGFVLLAIYFQTASLLIIAAPKWYMTQSLFVSLGFALPVLLAAKFKTMGGESLWLWLGLATPATYALTLTSDLAFSAIWVLRRSLMGFKIVSGS